LKTHSLKEELFSLKQFEMNLMTSLNVSSKLLANLENNGGISSTRKNLQRSINGAGEGAH